MKKLLIATATILALSTQANVMALEKPHTTVGQKIDDAKIVTVLNADLVKDKELSAIKINVDSTQGQVVLKGTAPNAAAKERAEAIAKGVTGVVSVDNRLMLADNNTVTDKAYTDKAYNNAKSNVQDTAHNVNHSVKNTANKAGNKLDDAAINVSVNSGLAGDADLSALKINVDVKHGQVWLKGTAPSLSAKNRATDIAKNVDGVTSVTNQLTVNNK